MIRALSVRIVSLVLWVGLSTGYGQIRLKGHLTDSSTGLPIPFANIGILNTKVGTISNTDGTFEISIPDSLKSRKIIFSAIGYEQQKITSLELNKEPNLRLKPVITRLKNVEIIASKNPKSKWLGNKKKALFLSGSMDYDSVSAGAAKAILINREKGLTNVHEAHLFIARNTLPEFKVRVRFLKKDKISNLPTYDLINKSIVITSRIRKGWLKFDLTEHNIYIEDQEFFLVFEWLYEKKDRVRIARAYAEYMLTHPEDVIRYTAVVDGIEIPVVNVKNYSLGTFFGTSNKPSIKSYSRSSSFDQWQRTAKTTTAKVLMSD